MNWLLTLCTPFGLAILPRQLGAKRGEHIENGPGNYEIIIQHNNGRNDNHAGAQTTKEWTESTIDGHWTKCSILAKGELHEHQRQTRYDKHYGEGY